MSTPLAISFRDAVSLVGGFPVLAGVSLEVSEGESILLHGPNGAGKTSLLRACAGLLAISGGEAVVLGVDLRVDREAIRREVGLLGHASFLYEDLTVEDNLVFALRAAHASTTRLALALERLGLAGRLRRTRVGRLSTGQRRRVSIAALYARAPRLWLLDEPHAGLDVAGRTALDEIVTEAHEAGATVLIASHELERARLLTTRAIEIAGGRARSSAGSDDRVGAASPRPLEEIVADVDRRVDVA